MANNRLGDSLYYKWDRAYSEMCGYVSARLSMNLVQSFSMIVWGARSGRPHPVRIIPAYGVETFRIVMLGY